MSIFESYALPVITAWKSKNLLELLKKNNISPDHVLKVKIGPRHFQVISAEIASNTLLKEGEFVEIFLYKNTYYQGHLSDQ